MRGRVEGRFLLIISSDGWCLSPRGHRRGQWGVSQTGSSLPRQGRILRGPGAGGEGPYGLPWQQARDKSDVRKITFYSLFPPGRRGTWTKASSTSSAPRPCASSSSGTMSRPKSLQSRSPSKYGINDKWSLIRKLTPICQVLMRTQSSDAQLVKAESEYNLCHFEHALVTYYKGGQKWEV